MHFIYSVAFVVTVLSNSAVFGRSESKPEKNEDVFEQDLANAFNIDPSTQGVQKVNLKCGAESMHVQLETEDDFTGVMYTRGSFYEQSEPCFVRPKGGKARSLQMDFSFDKCRTVKDGEVYSNIVVVQHDPELVTPGDSAFSLECDFRKPRSINMEANFQARDRKPTKKANNTSP